MAVAVVLVVALVVGGALWPSPADHDATEGNLPGSATTDGPAPTPSGAATPSGTATSDPVARTRGGSARVVLTGTVADVVDGDTIDMSDGTRVRLAIVDTPEVHGGTERCGPEASAFTARHVGGEVVSIVRPAGAPQTDPYDRVLGEVIRRRDGWSLNVALVRQGLGTIDERYTGEDPDLAARARRARADASSPDCAPVAVADHPPM